MIATRMPTYLHHVKASTGEAILPLFSELVCVFAGPNCHRLLPVLRVHEAEIFLPLVPAHSHA